MVAVLTRVSMLSLMLSPAGQSWALGAVVGCLPLQQESHQLRLSLQTDVLTSVPNNKVKLSQSGQTRAFFTDADGVSGWSSIQPDVPITLTLKQKNTPGGLAVGQVRDLTIPSQGVDHPVFDLLTFYQPLLQPVVLDSSIEHSIGLGTRWKFEPLPDSTYAFPASIGVLLTPNVIEAFRAYYGLQLEVDDYMMGIIISVDDAESLGDGTALEVDFGTYGITGLPSVDWYHVAFQAADIGSAHYEVAPALWEPSESPDRAYYFLTGTLGKGMNVLLFGTESGGNFGEQLASPPAFPPSASAGGTIPLTGRDCTPQPAASAPGQTCAPSNPCEDDPGCPDSGSCTMTASDCGSWKVPIGQKACGKNVPGGENQVTWTSTHSGGINWKITIGDKEAGGSVEAGGSAGQSTSTSHTKGMPLGEGAYGCGECGQWFQEYTACRKQCTVHRKHFSWFLGGRWYCEDETCTMSCVKESGQEYATCSRPCG